MRKSVLILVFTIITCCAYGCKHHTGAALGGSESGGSSSAIAVDEVSSEAQTSSEAAESKNFSSSEASSKTSSKTETLSSKPSSTSSKVNTSSKAATNSSTLNTSSKVSIPDGWLTDSTRNQASPLLTYTQADVGKVIGYSDTFNQYITVAEVREENTVDGRRCIRVRYYPTGGTSRVECEYCHEFPCPEDGDTNCPKYDPLKDGSITCQRCGKPRGDGYNGTCHNLTNWDDPTKPFISCNYYD